MFANELSQLVWQVVSRHWDIIPCLNYSENYIHGVAEELAIGNKEYISTGKQILENALEYVSSWPEAEKFLNPTVYLVENGGKTELIDSFFDSFNWFNFKTGEDVFTEDCNSVDAIKLRFLYQEDGKVYLVDL